LDLKILPFDHLEFFLPKEKSYYLGILDNYKEKKKENILRGILKL
jgi:hypothetical protein